MTEEERAAPSPLERPRRSRARFALKLAGLVAATAAATAVVALAGVTALWNTESGTRWLLARLPGILAEDVHGSLGGGDLRLGSLHADEAGAVVDITDLRVTGLRLAWHPAPQVWLGVAMDGWDAAAVRVSPRPSPAKAAAPQAPATLHSPVALAVARLHVGTLTIGTAAPLREVRAAVALGTEGGRVHRVSGLSFGWEKVLARGELYAQTEAPLNIQVTLDARDAPPDPGAPVTRALPHWAASATLKGPLAGFDVAASLRGEPRPGRAAPQAQLSARVTPFARLPVSEVDAKTAELDLSAISAAAPATRLEGTLRLATTQPAALDARLRNLAPAAWSQGGLPVSAVDAQVSMPWSGEAIEVSALRVALADAQGAGGELRAHGHWRGDAAELQLDLDQVQPARLDDHLGAWRVAGPLRIEATKLPPPNALWGGAPSPGRAASAPASAASSALPAAFADWNARVTGKLAGTAPPLGAAPVKGKVRAAPVIPPPMALQLDAQLSASALTLKQFDLRAGPASVGATAAVRRAGERWTGEARAQWAQLDPGAWWRLADRGPLHDGPNVLAGSLELKLDALPVDWQGLAAVRGKAALAIAPSRLAGVPLEGTATLDAGAAAWAIAGELRSGANVAKVDGSLRPGRAAGDALAVLERAHLALDAPELATLAPLAGGPVAAPGPAPGPAAPGPAPAASAVAALAQPKTLPGEIVAQAATKVATGGRTADTRALAPALAPSSAQPAVAGSWPTKGTVKLDVQLVGGRLALGAGRATGGPLAITTTGEIRDVEGPGLRVLRARWSAQASSDPRAPLAADVSVRDAQWGVTRLAHLQATLSGTLADHRLQLGGDAPVSPPEWLAHLADLDNANASRLDAQVAGHWDPAGGIAWQGRVSQLELRATNIDTGSRAGQLAANAVAAALAPWVQVQPFELSLSRGAGGELQTLRVGASQATIAGLGLAWQPGSWTAPAAPGGSAHWAFELAVAPFSVARTLARAQPDLGWHGDLQVEARLKAAFDGQWHVDGHVARTSGDLSVSELASDPANAQRALGLQAAFVQVKAEGLHWTADASIIGSRLGELTGTWTAEAPSPASLPAPGSPLRGHIDAHVADLNVWGAWLPPGWRLGGEMRSTLALGGQWGAPKVTGELTAQRLVVRNALEGVYAHDGDVDIRLTGEEARIDRFHILAGNGELTLAGSGTLGAKPVARLQLQARQFQLLGRIDRRIVTSGALALQVSDDALKVDGKMAIDEGLFDLTKGGAPTLDSDVEVLGPGGSHEADAADAAAAGTPKTGRATQIALGVDLGEKLHLKGRGLDTYLRGALDITSPQGQLAVRGNVRTVGGTYKAYGQNLQVSRGDLSFTGPVGDPRLDILAERPNLDVMVGVAITGTALAPHVRLVSDPEMSDADKLSWLMLGRAPEGLGSADTALLQQAAIALLAGEDEAPTDQLISRLGLTDFSFRQQEDDNQVRQTVVSLGRQLTKRWYVGYERGVNATTGSWQLIYRIAQRLTVRAQSGEEIQSNTTGNSLDVIYTWRWD